MKILFFGSSNYCLPILEALNNNFQLVAVITKSASPLQSFCLSHNIKVFTPKDKTELLNLIGQIRQIKPDLAIVVDYGLIIPKEIFTLPRYKTLNIHFSKLPKLRGPSPVQYTILSGEKSAWITVIIMNEGIDTGDIIWQREVPLAGGETSGILKQQLFNITAKELSKVINQYVQGKLKPQKQDHAQATYTKHLTRESGFIPPRIFARAINCGVEKLNIERAIRAFSPWPGIWTIVNLPFPKRLKLLKAHLEERTFVLDLVQLEGKKPVSWKQFLEGYPHYSF